jgi:hypothetical protein
MRISRIGVVGLAAAAMLASGAGYALAASPGTTITGTQHFSLMTTEPSAARYVVITTGKLGTYGGVDIAGAKADLVDLGVGTFRVHHGAAVTLHETLNPLTCLATFTGKSAITIGQGTGLFKGISGSGSATINALAIFGKNKAHRCATGKNPTHLEQTISANATVTLP